MFEENSFVVRPPLNLSPHQRMCLEGIAFAARAAMSAIDSIRKITAEHNTEDAQPFSEPDLLTLYTSAWTVVDQVHMLRQLLKTLTNGFSKSGPSKDFYDAYEVATEIRNAMDHFHQKLGNLASAKSPPPLFGALMYFKRVIPKEQTPSPQGIEGDIVTVLFGALTNGKFPGLNPVGKAPGNHITDLFEFHAHGKTLPIYKLTLDLPKLASHLDSYIKNAFLEVAETYSREKGVSMEQLTGQPGAGLTVVMRFKEI